MVCPRANSKNACAQLRPLPQEAIWSPAGKWCHTEAHDNPAQRLRTPGDKMQEARVAIPAPMPTLLPCGCLLLGSPSQASGRPTLGQAHTKPQPAACGLRHHKCSLLKTAAPRARQDSGLFNHWGPPSNHSPSYPTARSDYNSFFPSGPATGHSQQPQGIRVLPRPPHGTHHAKQTNKQTFTRPSKAGLNLAPPASPVSYLPLL